MADKPDLEEISRQLRERERRGLPKRSAEEQAKLNDWHKRIGQALVDGLNRNVLAEAKAMEPGADWSELRQGERVFRLSPDGTQARELGPDGFWRFVRADYVREHGTRL